jgi:ribosome biogenesis SPOUT family RNA methylase Rps3
VERFAITTTASAGAVVFTFTDAADVATITYDHDATAEFVVNHAWEALEIDSATYGAADGTNCMTVADSTGVGTFVKAPVSVGGMIVTSSAATLSSDSFAVSNVKAHIRISPETSTSDTLATITGGTLGQVIYVAPAKEGDTFTITDTADRTANAIHLSAAYSMEGINDYLVLMFDGLAWAEIGRGNND